MLVSLREPTKPVTPPETAEGGVEIPWKIFAGDLGPALVALLRMRQRDEADIAGADAGGAVRAHVTRGLGYLASGTETKSIADFIRRWIQTA